MSSRSKILVVDRDLTSLSKLYLALVHRNYKTEASDKPEEITERMKRLKPALIILEKNEYLDIQKSVKIPCIVLLAGGEAAPHPDSEEVVFLKKPVQVESLLRSVEKMII